MAIHGPRTQEGSGEVMDDDSLEQPSPLRVVYTTTTPSIFEGGVMAKDESI